MPPVNPSPHRFLAGQRRQISPSKAEKPRPATRRPDPPERDATPQRPTRAPAASQFAATPRFSFGRPRARSPAKPNPAQALRNSSRPVEDVQETREQDDESDEMLMLDDEQADAVPTTEEGHEIQQWANDLPYSPKRRKLDDFQREHSTPLPPKLVFKHPTTPASRMTSGAQNVSRAGSVPSTAFGEESTIRRPPFLRSSITAPEQFEPLPEAFSPHRRGEKFITGGLAATMQQWVIETGQAAAHSRKGQGYLKGEDYVLRATVVSVCGRCPLSVQGQQLDGDDVNLMLVVDSKKDVIIDVPVGSVIGIRAPTWNVQLQGTRWTVGVDWKVLR